MSKRFWLFCLAAVLILPCIAADYANAGMDYTKALYENNTPEARISALKSYLQTYTDSSNKFVQLAHFQLAANLFQTKNYGEAIQAGEKATEFNQLSTGEKSRLCLILANSFAIKGSPTFNQDKALSFSNKAMNLGNESGEKEVVAMAQDLKSKLAGPPPKNITPDQKLKFQYQNDDYAGVIATYGTLGAEKDDPQIHELYAISLFKVNKFDAALKEYNALYAKDKKGKYAIKIADCYQKKAGKNAAMMAEVINLYLEASILFAKEGNADNERNSLRTAKFQLYEKYGLNDKIKKYNESVKKNQSSGSKNEAEIRKAKKDLRDMERKLRNDYPDIDPPDYELKKVQDLKKKIAALESGASPQAANQSDDLTKEIEKVEKEFNDLLAAARQKVK